MTLPTALPTLERPAFFPGERLTADDLAAAQHFHRDLRWLHTRALHDWGVALGMAVSGGRGDKVVHVTPGLGIDALGREVILDAPLDVQVPAVAGSATGDPIDFYLTASYLDDATLSPETRGGDCGTSGAVRLPEGCAVRFQHPASYAGTDWTLGSDIVLASVKVRDCKLAAPVTRDGRRELVPSSPYVQAGATTPGNTPWSLWVLGGSTIGVTTIVSTARAGFTRTPRYQMRIGGLTSTGSGVNTIHVTGYPMLTAETPHSFTVHVFLPQGVVGTAQLNKPNPVLTQGFMQKLTSVLMWHVVWMGIEG